MNRSIEPKRRLVVFFPYSMGDTFFSGGVPKVFIAGLADAITSTWDTNVIVPLDNAGLVAYLMHQYPEVTVHQIDFAVPSRFKDSDRFWERLAAIIKRTVRYFSTKRNVQRALQSLNPSLVHFQTISSFPYLRYGKKLGAKVILHVHVYRIAKPKLLLLVLRKVCRKYVDLLLTPTEGIQRLFEGNVETRVIKNPVIRISLGEQGFSELAAKEEMTSCLPEGTSVDQYTHFVYLGRISLVKQIHYFIEAIALLAPPIRENMHFWVIGKPNIAGDISYYEALVNKANNIGVSNQITFLGYKENIYEYLAHMDIGVLLSESEATPMSGIEYMFSGLPVLAFDNPGLCELVRNGVSGFLVRDGDVSKLAELVEFCVQNPELLKTMGIAAKEQVKKEYSIKKYVQQLLALYDEVTLKEGK